MYVTRNSERIRQHDDVSDAAFDLTRLVSSGLNVERVSRSQSRQDLLVQRFLGKLSHPLHFSHIPRHRNVRFDAQFLTHWWRHFHRLDQASDVTAGGQGYLIIHRNPVERLYTHTVDSNAVLRTVVVYEDVVKAADVGVQREDFETGGVGVAKEDGDGTWFPAVGRDFVGPATVIRGLVCGVWQIDSLFVDQKRSWKVLQNSIIFFMRE